MEQSNKLVPGSQTTWAELKEVWDVHAKAGLIPRDLTVAKGLVCLALGDSLGVSGFEAMRGIVAVDGKPTIMSGLMQAIAQRDYPNMEIRVVEYTREVCTLSGRVRSDREFTTISYDMEDAKAAGLAGKQNWKKHPKAMLYARAVSTLIRMLCARSLHGLYTPDELGAIEEEDGVQVTFNPPQAEPETGAEAPVVDVVLEDPDPDREKRLVGEAEDLANRIADAKRAAANPIPEDKPKKRKPRSRPKKQAPKEEVPEVFVPTDWASKTPEEVGDSIDPLEGAFVDGRDGEELAVWSDALHRARDSVPEWDDPDNDEAAAAYAAALEAEKFKMESAT